MSSPKSSARFFAIYESLPQDEQRALVEKYLSPLLDSASSAKAANVLTVTSRIQKRHIGMPILDLRDKKAELSAMLDALSKDIKRSFVTESTSRNELLNESVRSLTTWLSDIWTVVYEHNVNFVLAHDCLLFVIEKLDQIANIRSGCRCTLSNMYLPVTLRNKSGKKVKTFHVVGTQNLQEVLEFIWRDMFLSMLASDKARYIEVIPSMLRDIESHLSWKNLSNVFYGGENCSHEVDIEDNGDDDNSDVDDGAEQNEYIDEDLLPVVADGEDEEYEDEENIAFELGDELPQRCKHWSCRVYNQVQGLRSLIQEALVAVFEEQPSVPLFVCLKTLSPTPHSMKTRLLDRLEPIATSCSNSFATTLDIYAMEDEASKILKLLDSHSYLLRSRDCDSLRAAVKTLSNHDYQERVLQILEKELLDTTRAIRQSLLLSYSQLDSPENKSEVIEILKIRSGTMGRRNRVEAWVDAITTPGAEQPNPFMFAALMMGMPAMPGMNHDDDQYTYLDIDPHDLDLEDLRAEYRPALKYRFESWANFGVTVKGGPDVLLKVYKILVEMLPFLKASDATEEMIARLQDRVSKKHVCEGLDALLAFVKVQRRKRNQRRTELQKKKEDDATSAALPTSSPTATSGLGAMMPPASAPTSNDIVPGLAPPNPPGTGNGNSQGSSHPALPAPPSFDSFAWNIIGNAPTSTQTGPAAPAPSTPLVASTPLAPITPVQPLAPIPPQANPFAPFTFFFTPAPPVPPNTADHDMDEGLPPYGGGIEDVD